MSNGDKIPLEKAKKGSEARKKFIAVRQKYGDPETLGPEALGEIKTAYEEFTDEMRKLKLKLTGESQSETASYMHKVETRYAALQRPAETEEVIDAEAIEETEEKPDDHADYQTIAPEADDPDYQPPQAPETATEADLRAQAKEKYKHFDESIEHIGKWLEDARARNEERKARAEKERAEDAARNAAGS
jgi:chemotaxis protein histidine kinase CheA